MSCSCRRTARAAYSSAAGAAGTSTTGDWLYTSNAFRGEGSAGTWRVAISDRWRADEGRLVGAELSFSGSAESPDGLFVFTDAFSDYAGTGHATVLRGPRRWRRQDQRRRRRRREPDRPRDGLRPHR